MIKQEQTNVDIKKVHSHCLQIANEMHRILTSHNIPYFMVGGTLLGSIRHKGFIPWDDDMDFGIIREYYWTAIDILRKELKYPYKCISYKESSICLHESCKIMDMSTRIQEDDYCSDEKGVFIDLFPYDYSDGKTGLFSNYMIIKTLVRLQNYRFTNVTGRNKLLVLISNFIKFLFYPLNYKTIPNLIGKHLVQHKGMYVICHVGLYNKREIIEANVIGCPRLMPFEDTFFYGMEKAEEYLTHIYGDYMQIPPEDKRRIHLINTKFL